MPSPRFSIVIPTRNRAETLAFTLRTCLCQQFEDFEVIVSDNDSPPETRAVVDTCGDKRVKYVRTPASLAMTDSWEFALGHASGEFVTIIGDDDGFLVHALSEIDRILRMADARVLRWDSVLYSWPNVAKQQYTSPNSLVLPLRMENMRHCVRRLDSVPMIRRAANSHLSYSELPMIYCSAVHRDLLEQLRRKTGRVFKSRTPDVYSAFAIAHVAGSFHSVDAPLNIAGLSGKSNGVAQLFVKERNSVATDFNRLNSQAGFEQYPIVPDLPRMPPIVADAFLHAKDVLFPSDSSLGIDRKELIVNCLHEAEVDAEEEWQHVLAVCRRSLADDADLLAWFDSTHGNLSFDARPKHVRRQVGQRYGGTYLSLDASEFGVADVVGAAHLCEKLLGYKRDGLNAHLQSEAAPVWLHLELQEKEAMIQLLDNACKERLVVIETLALQVQTLEQRYAKQPPGRVRRFLGRLLRRVKLRAAA